MNAKEAVSLQEIVAEGGTVPLVWAGSTSKMDYLNFGDALSPVIVALASGLPIERVPSESQRSRMVAVGTIGQSVAGGEAWFWGTGCSSYRNPSSPLDQRVTYAPPSGTHMHVLATRGPISRALLSGDPSSEGVYGDPVWLLPRFYQPKIEKRYELGVILHLSELRDRSPVPNPKLEFLRYVISGEFSGSVKLINTVTPIHSDALREKIDEILCCRRIVSTSLHGMVIAETYGIPCLYFAPSGSGRGLQDVAPAPDQGIDLRIADLYSGLGVKRLPIYVQNRREPTDWDQLIRAIDQAWQPSFLPEDELLAALPIQPNPVAPPAVGSVFDLPLLRDLLLQHDVGLLKREDRRLSPAAAASRITEPPPPTGLRALVEARGEIPLAWVAATRSQPQVNLGDALSPLIVAAISGRRVAPCNFDSARERLVAVGTIGQAQRNGTLHFWGTGFDATRNAFDPDLGRFAIPPDTRFHVHAIRGRRSAEVLRAAGVRTPGLFGDPVWFLPRLMVTSNPMPQTDLGIVVHISELETPFANSGVKSIFHRYDIPPSMTGRVKIINTFTDASPQRLFEKVDEIRACRRIASTSFHGLVIAETFGIPNLWFGPYAGGARMISVDDLNMPLDHRVRDWYSGTRKRRLPIYAGERGRPTDWEALMRWIDQSWTPCEVDEAALFNAFPLPQAVGLEDPHWPLDLSLIERL